MSLWNTILMNLPEVAGPTQKRLSFKEKLKWTLIILVVFFVLGLIPLYGLADNALKQFAYLSIILAAKFGSIVSLGIGPIVTSSIVLQLLNGSGIVKFDLTSHEGKKRFQGTQKLLSIFFIAFEAFIYVFMGGLTTGSYYDPITHQFLMQATTGAIALSAQTIMSIKLFLVFQLFLGGILILFMDEVVSKWGFGSGISLFIAAGVSERIFVQAFNWLPGPTGAEGVTYSIGAIPALFQSLAANDVKTALEKIAAMLSTILVFVMSVYVQAMKVEIPLSFGRIRGHGVRWPLAFIYTSNIPVILVAALIANMQLWGRLVQNWVGHGTWFASFGSSGYLNGGFVFWIRHTNIVKSIIDQGSLWLGAQYLQALSYILFMIGGAVLFSIFWVQTAGMDARSQAKNMMSSGLQIPGFRKDERVLERLLNRYILPLTVMGAVAVGFLAASADLTGALSSGTGILLAVMIVYKLYEEIAQQHMMDMNPMMRKFMGG